MQASVAQPRRRQVKLTLRLCQVPRSLSSDAQREVQETGLDIEIKAILKVVSNFFMCDVHSMAAVLLTHVIGTRLGPATMWFRRAGSRSLTFL